MIISLLKTFLSRWNKVLAPTHTFSKSTSKSVSLTVQYCYKEFFGISSYGPESYFIINFRIWKNFYNLSMSQMVIEILILFFQKNTQKSLIFGCITYEFNMRSEIVGGAKKKRCFFHFMVDFKFHELCECLS